MKSSSWPEWENRCSDQPDSESTCWDDLKNKEESAATALCYDEGSWDGDSGDDSACSNDDPSECDGFDFSLVDWDEADWEDIESNDCALQAMEALGWTKDMWDGCDDDCCVDVPESYNSCWDGLSDNEQCWIENMSMGFDEDWWNNPSGVQRRELADDAGRKLSCVSDGLCSLFDDCCNPLHQCRPAGCSGKYVCTGRTGSSCFSRDTQVDVLDKGLVPIYKVEVGDKVLTEKGYSEIYGFGRRDHTTNTPFLKITLESSKVLEISPDHIIFIGKKKDANTANDVKVGDELMIYPSKEFSKVVSIEKIVKLGAYHPYTYDGTIVVNGILASNYDAEPFPITVEVGGIELMGIHGFKNLMYAPLRVMCKVAPDSFCGPSNHYDDDGSHHWVEFIIGLEELLMPYADEETEHNFFEWSGYLPVRLVVFFWVAVAWCIENIVDIVKAAGTLGVAYATTKAVKQGFKAQEKSAHE